MKVSIHKCDSCKVYTLKEYCPGCGSKTKSFLNYKFKYDEKYIVERIKIKYGLEV